MQVPQLSSLSEDEEDVEPMEEDTPEVHTINTNTPQVWSHHIFIIGANLTMLFIFMQQRNQQG